jgi:DNA-binding IclR family transcriptional regulator
VFQWAIRMPKANADVVRAIHRSGSDRYRIQVLDRAFSILDVLAEAEGELDRVELAKRLSLHKSTLHRLLMILEQRQLIRKSRVHGKYSLGMRLFELGSRAIEQVDLRDRAEPFLCRLVKEVGETSHIAILNGTEMLSIINVQGPRKVRTPTTSGGRIPVHCTAVGKALLAFLPIAHLRSLIPTLSLQRFTDKTIVTREALEAELLRVRARGYAVDDEEIEDGLRCVGAPIHGHGGQVVAAISIAGPIFRMAKRRLPELGRAVSGTAHDLSFDLGYRVQGRAAHRSSADQMVARRAAHERFR